MLSVITRGSADKTKLKPNITRRSFLIYSISPKRAIANFYLPLTGR